MKILKSPQKVIILFLSVLIVTSFIMIIRLEGKAASLQSKWDEHQKSLKNNEDFLTGLRVFGRYTGKNQLKVDDSNILLVTDKSWVTVADDEVSLLTEGNIRLGSWTDKYLGYDSQKKLTYINHDGAQVTVGNITAAGKKYNGVLVRSANGNTQLVMTDKGLMIGTTGKTGEYRFNFIPGKDILKLSKGKSELIFEKDNIDIEAVGDINITSKNGNVNINGKKVNLNE